MSNVMTLFTDDDRTPDVATVDEQLGELAGAIRRADQSFRETVGTWLATARDLHNRYKGGNGFDAWVTGAVGKSVSWAYEMIEVAEALRLSAVAENLSSKALVQLNRAPAEVQEKVIEQITLDGKVFTAADIKRLREEADAARKEAGALTTAKANADLQISLLETAKAESESDAATGDLEKRIAELTAENSRLREARAAPPPPPVGDKVVSFPNAKAASGYVDPDDDEEFDEADAKQCAGAIENAARILATTKIDPVDFWTVIGGRSGPDGRRVLGHLKAATARLAGLTERKK